MIDFLPVSEKQALRKEYRLRVFTVCLGMCSVVLVLSILSYLPTYFAVSSQYTESLISSQSPETKDRLSQVKEVEMAVSETNKKIDTLLGGVPTPLVKDIFLDVLQSRPLGVVITHLSYDRGGVVSKKGQNETVSSNIILEGRSLDRKTLLLFKEQLAQKKKFSTIDLPLSSLVKETDLGFTIKLSLAENVPAASK
ncbi:MAG: hypothetical protein HYT94_00205 [Parcubacteria group bacterium]|nr:hypothetical protein [Parcubacteria group bacterium]